VRPHSGWAAFVVVSAFETASVLERRRVVLADPKLAGSKQPYHAAEDLPAERARRLLSRFEAGARRHACEAFDELLDALRTRGVRVVRCALLLASGRPLPELPSILASHALIHTADGEHFRDAIRAASESRGIPLSGVRERDLAALASSALGISPAALERRLADLGRPLGPPWTQDEKRAALAAWVSLAGHAAGVAS
jgi:hypothetical protein